jgi:hypothetical protein
VSSAEIEADVATSITAQCLDTFIAQRSAGVSVDPRLTEIVERVLEAGKEEGGKLVSFAFVVGRRFWSLKENRPALPTDHRIDIVSPPSRPP